MLHGKFRSTRSKILKSKKKNQIKFEIKNEKKLHKKGSEETSICRRLFQRKIKVKPKIFVFDRKIAKEKEENGLRKNFP